MNLPPTIMKSYSVVMIAISLDIGARKEIREVERG